MPHVPVHSFAALVHFGFDRGRPLPVAWCRCLARLPLFHPRYVTLRYICHLCSSHTAHKSCPLILVCYKQQASKHKHRHIAHIFIVAPRAARLPHGKLLHGIVARVSHRGRWLAGQRPSKTKLTTNILTLLLSVLVFFCRLMLFYMLCCALCVCVCVYPHSLSCILPPCASRDIRSHCGSSIYQTNLFSIYSVHRYIQRDVAGDGTPSSTLPILVNLYIHASNVRNAIIVLWLLNELYLQATTLTIQLLYSLYCSVYIIHCILYKAFVSFVIWPSLRLRGPPNEV